MTKLAFNCEIFNNTLLCAKSILTFPFRCIDTIFTASSSSKDWQFYVMPGQTDLIHGSTTFTASGFPGLYMNRDVRKSIFEVSDKVWHKPDCTVTEVG